MVKKEQNNNREEAPSLRERIRDQKYSKGFMQPDFSKVSAAGRAHIEHLAKPIPLFVSEASSDNQLQNKETACVVEVMNPTLENRANNEAENSNHKAEQGS